jgi:hypothetical protein
VGTKTSVAESRMAFASYAKGKAWVLKTVLPAPSFLKVNVVSFVLVLWLNHARANIKIYKR